MSFLFVRHVQLVYGNINNNIDELNDKYPTNQGFYKTIDVVYITLGHADRDAILLTHCPVGCKLMADVFISYKRTERARVERIAELFRKSKIDVWFDASLEAGRGEGFDSEIEREVTSASCVLVCWTHEALKSVYVKAEAKKGLEREVMVPIFLEQCTLPVPFNAIDTIDLSNWSGDEQHPSWSRLL